MHESMRLIPGTKCYMDINKNVYSKTGSLKKEDNGSVRIEGVKKKVDGWFCITFPEQVDNGSDIDGFSNYSVSRNGDIYSKLSHRILNPSEIKPNAGSKIVYLDITLISDLDERVHWAIHRLVATVFLENKDNLDMVNHKDCNGLNNNVENLEWCSHEDNVLHAMLNGRLKDRSYPVLVTNIETKYTKAYMSMSQFERASGFSRSSIKRAMDTGSIYKGFSISSYEDDCDIEFEIPTLVNP